MVKNKKPRKKKKKKKKQKTKKKKNLPINFRRIQQKKSRDMGYNRRFLAPPIKKY